MLKVEFSRNLCRRVIHSASAAWSGVYCCSSTSETASFLNAPGYRLYSRFFSIISTSVSVFIFSNKSVQLSDKRQLLPAVALLRTVRASFPAHGSSLYEALLWTRPLLRCFFDAASIFACDRSFASIMFPFFLLTILEIILVFTAIRCRISPDFDMSYNGYLSHFP